MGIFSWLLGGQGKQPKELAGDGGYEFEVVGESFYQDALDAVAGPKSDDGVEEYFEAVLIPEPNNKFDSNAVAVKIRDKKVAHLDRASAAEFQRFLSGENLKGNRFLCDAVVVGGWKREDGDEGHYGVKLDLEWPPRLAG